MLDAILVQSRMETYMALIVQKYGGTSVGDPKRIENVAERVSAHACRAIRLWWWYPR
jgi:hypothetical protein